MLFSPVEILRKYGFNPPLGLFIDQSCGHVVQRSLTTADYSAFCDYASKQDTVKRLLEWYHSFGDLTEAEIISTWDTKEDGPFPGISEGLSKMFAKLRVLKLAMALPPDSREEINASEALFKELHTREGWMRLGRNRKQKNEKN
jgi:hypothetical protein